MGAWPLPPALGGGDSWEPQQSSGAGRGNHTLKALFGLRVRNAEGMARQMHRFTTTAHAARHKVVCLATPLSACRSF